MQPEDIRIGFVPIARPTFDTKLARQLTQQVYTRLQAAGYQLQGDTTLVMNSDDIQARIAELQRAPVDLALLLQSSFADSSMALQLARALRLPLLLWALPEAQLGGRLRINSFCGVHLAAHGLRRAGIAYETLVGAPDDSAAWQQFHHIAAAAAVKRQLRGARIGRLGEHPEGFDTCRINPAGLQSQLGVDIAQLELQAFFSRARQAKGSQVEQLAQELRARLDGFDALEPRATRSSLGVALALRDIVQEQGLAGMALRCWPEFFTELGCAACGAMSLLSDSMTPASCEADVNGTITQLILGWLSGQPAFGSDIVAFDPAADEATLWHCGLAPLSMADPSQQPQATIHSNRELPLLMQFTLKPGRVTLARISEATGSFRLVIGGGEMLAAPPAFSGTSGRIRFDSGAETVMRKLLDEGLEHHLSLTYGAYEPALLALARMLYLPVLRL